MTKPEEAVTALQEITEDVTVPRNIKEKLQRAIDALMEKNEESINIDKAMQALEEVAEDANLQAYTRTQIWGVVSLLEKS
jgi:uncharacterized protein (UPF0147 family)